MAFRSRSTHSAQPGRPADPAARTTGTRTASTRTTGRRLGRLAAVLGAGVLALPAGAAGADETPAGRQVPYREVEVTVPPDWQVVSFDKTPHACLRLDKPALYLGHAGDQTDCAASAVARDRGDTLHLEPADGAPERADIPTVTVHPGERLPDRLPDAPSRELRFVLERQGLVATVGYGASPDRVVGIVADVLAQDRESGGDWRTPRTTRPAVRAPVVPGAFRGRAFDACTAPSPSQMRAWRTGSPYRGIGVYIGGPARACAQNELTPDWVSAHSAAGWHLMPIWVGPQPWSGSSGLSTSAATAAAQGRTAADGAAAAAARLGLGKGTVLYNDVENYSDRAKWDRPVLAYLDAWTRRVREHGYRSGAYVAKSSGVQALSAQYTKGTYAMPDVLWTAYWNGSADTGNASMGLPAGSTQWPGARRAHQYAGNVPETYGGVRIAIDRNQLDVGGPAGVPDPALSVNDPRLMASVDLTGDGRADLAAVHPDGTLHSYVADAGGKLTYGQRLWPDRTWGSVRLLAGGDFTGTGEAQLAAVWADGSLHLYAAGEDGVLRHVRQMWADRSWRNIRRLATWHGGDGRDGLAAVWNNGTLHRYQGRADGTLGGRVQLGHDGTWRSVRHIATGRFTASGATDLVAVWWDGSLRLYPGSAAGTVGASRPMWPDRTWGTMRTVVAGDFNGSGTSDVMAYWHSRSLRLYAGPGNGTLRTGVVAAR
ncbi:DUF1906 domain-containing protein [Streptomyces bambusae]|uniref:glycoside hydrolase domain-containing protein n=1 Tax=Streptomyces bambusae TaxID=1550616 RepID=UPI001CFD9D6E|nr:glycoside hydrolase domain-containing protein [Streptomyces bambusae]MCB5165381.1 DUF1906 domain-containing protein [Streptomyces bambusae]